MQVEAEPDAAGPVEVPEVTSSPDAPGEEDAVAPQDVPAEPVVEPAPSSLKGCECRASGPGELPADSALIALLLALAWCGSRRRPRFRGEAASQG